MAMGMTVLGTSFIQAQTYKVLYAFTGGTDGKTPETGLSMDAAGNLYGTTDFGGRLDGYCGRWGGCGTVFKLTEVGSGWYFARLYAFKGVSDGAKPTARVVFGPDSNLYGGTLAGGVVTTAQGHTYGTIYMLTPPGEGCTNSSCSWAETVLYSFSGGADGSQPGDGGLTFDRSGNAYGTTFHGGQTGGSCGSGCGVVFKLSPSGDRWTESVLHVFAGGSDGNQPDSGVILDQAGNLYGETDYCGGSNCYGLAYELSPTGSGWVETVLHDFGFTGGSYPGGGLVFDTAGNLYGVTCCFGGGDAFELSPTGSGWTAAVLYSFTGSYGPVGGAGLVRDAAGNLYGTTSGDGAYGQGNVFKLAPSPNGWIYTDLHDFHRKDGSRP
jgi:uncharacterized repeat protein (TIGR03803 family)